MKKTLLTCLLAALPLGFSLCAENSSCDSTFPEVTKAVAPQYPMAARANGIEGTVLVQCLVDTDGTVLAVGSLNEESPLLSASAIEAVKQWKFAPREYAKAGPFLVKVPISFDLKSSAERLNTMNIAAR